MAGALVALGAAFLGGVALQRSLGTTTAGEGGHAAASTPGPPRVVVYGDSLVVEASPYLATVGDALGVRVTPRAHGGLAPCDALPWLGADLRRGAPDVVVLAFSGNSLTDCMRTPDGTHAAGPDLVAKYRADVELAIAMSTNAGAPVVLASPPAADGELENWLRIDSLYREIAAARGPYAVYTDAGIDIAPNGRFAPLQRCLPFELVIAPTKGTCGLAGSSITVRAGDGRHFCTDRPSNDTTTCTTYSSGAFRYAIALVTAATLDLAYVGALEGLEAR